VKRASLGAHTQVLISKASGVGTAAKGTNRYVGPFVGRARKRGIARLAPAGIRVRNYLRRFVDAKDT
jgi:hypothetical protein